jgi:type IV fimbrial biogenesis protein FimT
MPQHLLGTLRQTRKTLRHSSLGLTSVELMISIVLLSIVLSLALPSYRDMVEKRQLTQGAEQIFAFLNAAQGVASRSNSVVTVSYGRTDNNDWCVGAVLGETACDCAETVSTQPDFCSIDGSVMRLTNDHVGNKELLESVSGDGAYAFDPIRGLLVDLDDALSMDLYSPSGDYQLRLSVSNTGQTALCSIDGDHSVPGYLVCPAEAVPEEEG